MDLGQLTVNASRQLGDFTLDVSLTAEAGEVVGLTGDIGSGKSSTLAMIAGKLQAESGRVALGQSVWDEPETATFIADRPVTLMSQQFHNDLPENLSGIEAVVTDVIRFGADAEKVPAKAAEQTARSMLTELGVGDHVVDRLPWTFSGAEAQRVAMTKALAPRPSVVLLDEPFGALDKRTGTTVREWLADWLASYDGITIIVSTRVDHLEKLTDRIVSLSR